MLGEYRGADGVDLVSLVVQHLQVRVGHAADHLLTAEDAFCDLCRHQVYRVVLAHSGHGIAAVNAALPQGIRVGGVAYQSRAAKAVVVKGIQTLELFGILFNQRDIMADAFQIADEERMFIL